jgi:hypothetical protein
MCRALENLQQFQELTNKENNMEANLYNKLIVTNGDMTSNVTSPAMDMSQVDAIIFYATWTGTPTGTLKLQVSITTNDNDFVDLLDSSVSIAGVAGKFMWNIADTNFDQIRLVYVAGSSPSKC